MKKALVSYSAGIDSTVLSFLLRDQGYDVTLGTFDDGVANDPDLGLPYYDNSKPIDRDSFFCELLWYQNWYRDNYGFDSVVFRYPHLNLLNATSVSKQGNEEAQFAESIGLNFYIGFKPLMAMMLMSYGAANGYDIVAFGHMPYNSHYEDENPQAFTDLYDYMVKYYGSRIKIPKPVHPFYEAHLNSKEKVILEGYRLGVPFDYTYSCRSGELLPDGRYTHCGKCENCLERKRAFDAIDRRDPAL